jgi:hypothetical protein
MGRWKAWLRLAGVAVADGAFHRPVTPPPLSLGLAGPKKGRLNDQAGADADDFTKETGLAGARPAWRVSVRRVPDDDLLGLVITGCWGDVAVDGTESGRGQRDGDVLLPGVLRDPAPAAAQFEAVLAADDAVIGLVVLRLAGVLHERDLGGDAKVVSL